MWLILRRKIRDVLILLALASVTASCAGPPAGFVALESDPLSNPSAGFGDPTRRTEVKGTTSGTGAPSSIQTTWTVDTDQFEGALKELGDIATDAGWSVEPDQLRGFSGAKSIGDVSAQLEIAGAPDNGTIWIRIYARE